MPSQAAAFPAHNTRMQCRLCHARPCTLPADKQVPAYTFDPTSGPQQVFTRFFGTHNPYEALGGELGCWW